MRQQLKAFELYRHHNECRRSRRASTVPWTSAEASLELSLFTQFFLFQFIVPGMFASNSVRLPMVVSVKWWKKADVTSDHLHPLIANLLVAPRSPRKTTRTDAL
jgi:hypothetical protein